MFPFENEDEDLAYDDYGAALRPGEFRQAEGALASECFVCLPGMLPDETDKRFLGRLW
jgi:hypothetical protein